VRNTKYYLRIRCKTIPATINFFCITTELLCLRIIINKEKSPIKGKIRKKNGSQGIVEHDEVNFIIGVENCQ